MLLVFGLTQANRVGWGSAQTILVFAGSAVLMAFFLWNETRSRSPLVPLGIFKRRTLTGANVIGFGLGTVIFGIFFLLSLYMQQVLGFSAMQAGVGYLAVALTVVVAATVSQGLVTRLGVKPVLVAGMALLTVGMVYFTQVSPNGSYWTDLFPGFLIIGVGMGFSFVPISIAALAGVQGPGGRARVRAHQHEPADRRRAGARAPDHRRHDAHDDAARGRHASGRGAHLRLQLGLLGRGRLRARLADHDARRPPPGRPAGGRHRAGGRSGRLGNNGERPPGGRSPARLGSRLLDPREVVMFRAALAVLALLLTPGRGHRGAHAQFLGEEILPTGLQFEGTEVGGLSSIAYDAVLDRYYVISDDQSVIDPARYYTFDLDVADGTLDAGDVVVTDVTTLLDDAGLPFPAASFDPEGLALTSDDELVITSEGIASRLIPPWVRLFGLDGRQLEDLPVPLAFIPDAIPQTRGVRQNLGFESGATIGVHFFTGSEGRARPGRAGRRRRRPQPGAPPPLQPEERQAGPAVPLLTDPIAERRCRRRRSRSTASSSSCRSTGTPSSRWSARSRSASPARGTRSSSTPSSSRAREHPTAREPGRTARRIRPVTKTLLLDLDDLGIPLDNVEGMALGRTSPTADGRSSSSATTTRAGAVHAVPAVCFSGGYRRKPEEASCVD